MKKKFQSAVQFMKKKMQDFKKSNENNEIAIKVNNKDAQKQISQIQKQIDSLQEKINARQMKLGIITPRLDEIVSKTTKDVTPDGVSSDNPAIQKTVNNSLAKNKEYNTLIAQEEKMTQEIAMYNNQLRIAKTQMSQLKEETKRTGTSQNKMTSFFSAFKDKLSKIDAKGLVQAFSNIPKITTKINGHIKNMATGMRSGLSHVLKYAGALLSLRSIYSTLSNSANSWLSSQNAGAQQLSANINYMKYAMGSALAPVIQWVTNLVYQLMKAIQSVVYALFRVNIFANASAKSYASMAGSAKKAKEETKQLAGVHDEINNIQDNNNSEGGSGGSGATPGFDLSNIDSQLSPLAQKLYDFFKPLKESWDNYGAGLIEQVKITAGQVRGLIASVWGSFENIITNGTVYTTLELILAIIGNIAEAFANAWNYNGNGDAIVQNLANAFNNLLTAINNVVQSEGFQSWLNWCSDKFREISEKLASIDWQPLINALMQIGTTVGSIALDILSGLVDIFKWLVENPIIAEIIVAIAIAIAIAIGVVAGAINLITTAIGIYNTVMSIATTVSTVFGISIGWLVAIIVGIIAAIALIVLAIMNWDTIMKALADTWEWIKQKATEIFTALGEFFSNLWKSICDTVVNVWNAIVDFVVGIITKWIEFQVAKFEFLKNIVVTVFNAVKDFIVNVWNGIVNTISNVWNTIVTKVKEGVSGAWNAITSVFGNIAGWFHDKFSQAWQAVKNVFSAGGRIFDGIKEGILSGLKSIVNAIIGGINKVISVPFNGLNSALRAIKSVDIMGLRPFSWISTVSVPQIPKLAKGGVLYDETLVMAGEYSGASSNPEIVTPQNIMEETFDKVMSRYQGDGQTINLDLTVNVSNKKLGQILLEDLRDMKRRSGNGLEALVGG